MIDVRNLTKSYGARRVVDDVTFHVDKGEVVGFLGPNGAGKSTTLRMIAGYLGASRGTATVAGFDLATDSIQVRKRMGYMPEGVPLYPELRVSEYLRHRAELKQIPRRDRHAAVERAMVNTQIDDHAAVTIGHLSKGYRQRVGLADALLGEPEVLILDEPTSGLDPNQILDVRELIRSVSQGRAVLLSTHIMGEVEATCNRALIIHQGRLVAEGTLDKLRELRRSAISRLTIRGTREQIIASIPEGATEALHWHGKAEDSIQKVDVVWSSQVQEETSERLIAELVRNGLGVKEVMLVRPSLEEVFHLLTTSQAPGGES